MSYNFADAIGWAVEILVTLLIMNCATKMASRKNRSRKWGLWTLLFAPIIFVLWVLPSLQPDGTHDEVSLR
jgi:hypothetical protein